jgi:phosphatidate phosphatase APP1
MVVYPGYGYHSPTGGLTLRISGVVYEMREPLSRRKQFLVNMLAKAMRATPEEISHETFRRRVAPFVAKPRRGWRVWVQLGSRSVRLRRKTRRNGWFRGKITLGPDAIEQLRQSGDWRDDRIRLRTWIPSENGVSAQGTVFVLPQRGVSIVSDIDDTIKDSNVGNRRELLANTFLREYREIGGMAELYRQWAQLGSMFHYVSSSPWQLFDPISEWSAHGGFPPGTLHLRTFRLRDQVIRRKASAKRRKSQSISKMIKSFPHRRFILIGDSGERDPEIYGKLCQRFGDRIVAVLIRELDDYRLDPVRQARLRVAAGRVLCETFSTADDLRGWTKSLFPERHVVPFAGSTQISG